MNRKRFIVITGKVINVIFTFLGALFLIIIICFWADTEYKKWQQKKVVETEVEESPFCHKRMNDRFYWATENYWLSLYDAENMCFFHNEDVHNVVYTDVIGDSMLVYSDSLGYRGFMDAYSGEVVIKAKYDAAWLFNEGIAAVAKEDKIGFINKNDSLVIPFKFPFYHEKNPYTYRFYNGLCKMTNEEGLCGLIDRRGEWVLKPKYEKIKAPYYDDYRKVRMNDKWGIMDKNFRLIVPIEYDYVNFHYNMDSEIFDVTKDGKMYRIDKNGKILTDGIYYKFLKNFVYYDRFILVCVKDELNYDTYTDYKFKYGIYDILKSKEIVPAVYDEIEQNVKCIWEFGSDYIYGDNVIFDCYINSPEWRNKYHYMYDSKGNMVELKYLKVK